MRHFLVTVLSLLIISIVADAQYRNPTVLNSPDYDTGSPWHFRFSVSINFMDFDVVNTNAFEHDKNGVPFQYFANTHRVGPGFNVNAICDFRITENIHARFLPGYALGQRELNFFMVDTAGVSTFETAMKLESSFIELPVGFKYVSQRYCNVRPYLYAGANVRVDIAAFKRMKVEDGVLIRLAKTDIFYEVGFGIDFFLANFKFSTELKWSAGILNMVSDDYADGAQNYRDAIEHLRSRAVVIMFHFE